MEQQGIVVQKVVTTETTTEYEEEETKSDRFWRGLDRTSTLICVAVSILIAVTIVTISKEKKT